MTKIVYLFLLLCSALSCSRESDRKIESTNYIVIKPGTSPEAIVALAGNVTPSARQLKWQQLEMVAFLHFGINTFTNKEWGDGNENPQLFNPKRLDARQWVQTCKNAGMKQVIITAKHHDGFCLWPSKYTEHSVKNSPWRDGNGDVVREVADACRELGVGFGIYLSPWDRNSKFYGDSPNYNQYFLNQLTELLTNYGQVDEVWFDGACGEGPNGKRQVYDWEAYYSLIRKLQPEAVIAVMGPDVRWVGTETGYGRETEWSVVPAQNQNQDFVAENSQTNINFIPQGDLTGEDLGSREAIANATALAWYPAETDVSIRPGWFYHPEEDESVKSPEKLFDIYFSSVGRNSVLLLNIPPDQDGLISETDTVVLHNFKMLVEQLYAKNIASDAKLISKGKNVQAIVDQDYETYWTTDPDSDEMVVEINLELEETVDVICLQENIRVGQRIEKFRFEYFDGGKWQNATSGSTVGYKRLLRFPSVKSKQFRLIIESSRLNPTISELGLYKFPELDDHS